MRNIMKVGFCDTFGTAKDFFSRVLNRVDKVVRDDFDPEYLIFGDRNFGNQNVGFHSPSLKKRVFFTGEHVNLKDYRFDHAISMNCNGPNTADHFYLPLWLVDYDMITNKLGEKRIREFQTRPKTKHVCFVQSNPNNMIRNEFVKRFDATIADVDCGGPLFNNIGKVVPRGVESTLDFMADYEYVIAFENFQSQGYVTEKVLYPLLSGSIPIYWGGTNFYGNILDLENVGIDLSQHGSNIDSMMKHVELWFSDYLKHPDGSSYKPEPVKFESPNLFGLHYTYMQEFINWWSRYVYVRS